MIIIIYNKSAGALQNTNEKLIITLEKVVRNFNVVTFFIYIYNVAFLILISY